MTRALVAAIACVLLSASSAAAQQVRLDNLAAHVIVDSCSGCGGAAGPIAIDQTTPGTTNGVVVNNVPHIVCDSGCGSPPATADGSAFTFGTTSVSPIGAVVDDVGTNSVPENSFGAPRMSGTRLLYVDLGKTTANVTPLNINGTVNLLDSVNFTNGTILTTTPASNEQGLVVRNIPTGTQPVSGTFWQATQPVSGTFFQATQPVSGTFWQATQPVSGTFFQATQPVSLTTLPALTAGSAVIGHVIADTGSTTAVTGNVAVTNANLDAALSTLATSSAQSTGNGSLATIATNTGLGATAANQTTELSSLSSIKTNTDKLDIALSALRDAIMTTSTGGTTAVHVAGNDPSGTQQTLRTDPSGVLVMQAVRPLVWPYKCNALRKTNCQ